MDSPTNNTKTQSDKWRRHLIKVFLVIVTAFIALLILFDLSPFGGNIRFYSKWAECGVKPVQVDSKPGGGIVWYEESPAFITIFRNQSWKCTPVEAERAGYSANEHYYSTPGLDAIGEKSPRSN